MPRTRAARSSRTTRSVSSTATEPPSSVPVTTVPAPRGAKTRSIQSRGRPRSSAAGVAARAASRARRRSSSPRPETESHTTTWASRSDELARCSTTECRASSSASALTVSALVRATIPWRTPSTSRMRRCSSLCGIHPSLAATTNSATSTAPTPASMFLTKRSWPGTSTKPTVRPEGRSVKAKPRSMVSPRSFSSTNRSGSVPVSARTNDDLPWSTWPAVATTLTRRRGPMPLAAR